MKKTVRINKRNLTGLINKTSFKYSGGMFTSYGFIAINFDSTTNNTAKFYESVQVNANSWTNYPGWKIWHNHHEDWKKADVLERCVEYITCEFISEMEREYPYLDFQLIGFDE